MHTHLVGPQGKETVGRLRAGDEDAAARIDEEVRPALDILGVVVNPIAVKAALNLLGHEVGGVRLPLVEADPGEVAQIASSLQRLGLLERVAV